MSNINFLNYCRLSPKIAILGLSLGAVALLAPARGAIASFTLSSPKLNPQASTTEAVREGGDVHLAQMAQQPAEDREIVVEEVKGMVTYGPSMQAVTVGQRLLAGEQELRTGNDSTVRLHIDTYVGSVEVAENSTLKIKTLASGKTSLFVSQGRVRASIGSSTRNRSSEKAIEKEDNKSLLAQRNSSRGNYPVDIETPAGIAGVQGTSFGVNVGPNGKTGVSTLDGSVAAIAQGQTVLVNKGQYVLIEPGKAPSSPAIAPARAMFRVLSVRKVGDNGIRVIGQAAPLDLVYVNGQAVETDIDGKFSTIVPRPLNRRVKFVLRGPTATETHYEIAVL